MIAALLKAVRDRASFVKELEGVEIKIASNARFDSLVEGRLNAAVAPIAIEYDREARDIVKETTTVSLSVAEYFADKFGEDDVYGLLKIVPAIEQAFIGVDLRVGDALFRWDTSYALGVPFANMVKDYPGGLLDVGAADNEYVYQAPVVLRYVRHLKTSEVAPVALRDYPGEAEEIAAPDLLRFSIKVFDTDGEDMTTGLYQEGTLTFS